MVACLTTKLRIEGSRPCPVDTAIESDERGQLSVIPERNGQENASISSASQGP